MTVLRRPSTAARVLDLTRRLAEDYDGVPLPEVSRTVRELAGDVDEQPATDTELADVERRARRRLRRLSATN